MKKHTKEFKSSISTFGRELDSKIFVLGTELVLEKEDLFSITPVVNSEILKTIMKEIDFESKKQIGVGQEVNVKSGVKVNNEYEYIDYGNYSVYKSQYKAETDTYSHICYDKMLKTMINYTPLDITYPIDLREYINAIATKCGLEFADKNSTFANYNTSINEDHFSNGNYTFRDVLDYIAQLVGGWFCINDNDELEIRYPELARNYDKVSGENVSFISNVEDEINTIIVDGKSTQKVSKSKNLFNYKLLNDENTIQWKAYENLGTMFRALPIYVGANKQIYFSSNIPALTTGNAFYAINNINETSTNVLNVDNSRVVSSNSDGYVYLGVVTSRQYYSDVQNNIYWIMISDGEYDYEPYYVVPTPDYPSEIECVKGKNLYGNITWQVQTYAYFQLPTLNENYTLSLKLKEGKQIPAGLYVMFTEKGIYDTTQKRILLIDNGIQKFIYKNNTFDNVKLNYISVYTPDYKDTLQDYFDIQLEKGTVATDYLPYNTIQVKNVGKNLFDGIFELGIINDNTGQNETNNNYIRNKNYIPVEELTDYKFSSVDFTGSVNIYEYKEDFSYNLTTNKQIALSSYLTTNKDTKYIRFRPTSATTNLDLRFQLEKGTQATTYEPYQEKILNIDLQGNELCSLPNNVKDELVIENGKAKIIKNVGKYDITGNETWALSSTESQPYINFSNYVNDCKYPATTTELPNLLSNYYLQIVRNNLYDGRITLSPGKALIIYDTIHNTSLANFKEWLKSASVVVYYQLATPTEIYLGKVETLSTFKGINNVSLDASMQTNMNLIYTAEYEELDKHFLKDVNVSFSKKYGAVNSVVFSRGNGSDNIYCKDNTSINKNGLTEIKITNNPFLEGDDRENFIQQLFDKINGLEFYIMDVASTGIMYLELGDLYYFNMVEEKPSLKSGLVKSGIRKAQGSSGGKYICLLMNDEIKITQGLEENIYSDEPEITETNYKTASITDTSIKNAIIQTNKNSAEILLKVNNDEVISAINLSPENIKISSAKLDIDAIATFTNSKLAEAGSTVINGANITTGSINCDRLNGGTINGQAIRGGSISITKGEYYFTMGINTDNPSVSGLNVGKRGIKAHSDITATGFAITDSDIGKTQSINIYDGHGKVWYLTFTGGILTASEYK